MRFLIAIVIIESCFTSCIAQTQIQKDSIADEICKMIVSKKGNPDSIRISDSFSYHLLATVIKFNIATENHNDLFIHLYYRTQRNCNELYQIYAKAGGFKGDWASLNTKPECRLTKKECKEFKQLNNFTYLETSGDTVFVSLSNSLWIDQFQDGTFSKLKLKWLDYKEFEIEFIESNNETRRNLSIPGDKYRYQLIDIIDGSYLMSVEIVGPNRFSSFKLHPK